MDFESRRVSAMEFVAETKLLPVNWRALRRQGATLVGADRESQTHFVNFERELFVFCGIRHSGDRRPPLQSQVSQLLGCRDRRLFEVLSSGQRTKNQIGVTSQCK